MGLDVYVYKNVRKCTENEIKNDNWNFQTFGSNPEWLHKMKNLELNSYYSGESTKVGVGCSYSGHGLFRGFLVSLIGRQDLLTADKKVNYDLFPDNDEELPFGELINFSDCEGCLDWETASKLHQDFIDWSHNVKGILDNDENHYWAIHYFNWLKLLEVGKEVGNVVVFS